MTKCHLHFRTSCPVLDCDVMGPPPAEARGSPVALSGTRPVFDYLGVLMQCYLLKVVRQNPQP